MDTFAVDRKLHIEHRVAEQQARATIKKNPVLALVELITNSDDSYRRLENSGIKTSGSIIVELVRKHQGSTIRITDYAEGFEDTLMDERVGGYGGDTSGFTEQDAGRGYWGRGLKEAMIAMGFGSVESIKDNFFYKCTLENLDYKRSHPVKITKQLRDVLGVKNNGTLITIKANNADIRIPQFETLKQSLEYYYSLRDIVSNPSREIILIEKDQHNKIKRQEKLSYLFPKGELFYKNIIQIQGYKDAKINLEIYRATEPLSGYDDEGPLRENGLLLCSKGAILDITLTRKFEGNGYASRIFGHATCDYIDHLLRIEKEPIVHSNRSGLDWTHPFCKAIESTISKEVSRFVQEEEKKVKAEAKELENEKTRKRYEASLPELNKIAKEELGSSGGMGDESGDIRLAQLPPNGFDFMPDYAQIVVDKESTLTLKALVPKIISSGSVAKVTSDVKEIIIKDEKITLDEKDSDLENGLLVKHIRVIGKQVGVEGIISAEIKGVKTEMLVKVISKKIILPPTPKGKSGLFNGFEWSSTAEPNQRVKYDRASGKIIIATRAPSVAIYFGLNGEGQDEGHCQVMLAELTVEAVCREIARQKIESGSEPYLGEASEAMNVIHNRLINKYAEKIHHFLVEKKFRN
ncbi:hypothetical protein HY311_00850 [Candidatus Nomurabacteria bacterium]|nr:hypothetical protein [Candidatus Nomurabacteria bacterium]